jgi:hypothetical protein
MRFANTVATAADEIFTERGAHDVYFEDGDGAALLATAQPALEWKAGYAPAAGGTPALQYGAVAEISLIAARFDGDALKTMLICEQVPLASSLGRLWAEVRKGMRPEDWTPCSKGTFRARLLRAAESQSVDRDALVLRAGDYMQVPRLTSPPVWFTTLAWCESHFPAGPSTVGSFMYYAETLMGGDAVHETDSAQAAFLSQSAAVAKAAAMAAGSTANHLDSMRPFTRAAMVVEQWSGSEWPEALERWSAAGPPRELDAMDRAAYRRSGGLGAPAQKIVLGRLSTVLLAPSYSVLGHLVDATPRLARDAVVQALRRAQQVFRVDNADTLTLGSLARLAACLGQRKNLLQSEEVQRMAPDARVEYFVGLGEAPDTIAASGLGQGGLAAGNAPSGAQGARRSARFDEAKVRATHTRVVGAADGQAHAVAGALERTPPSRARPPRRTAPCRPRTPRTLRDHSGPSGQRHAHAQPAVGILSTRSCRACPCRAPSCGGS